MSTILRTSSGLLADLAKRLRVKLRSGHPVSFNQAGVLRNLTVGSQIAKNIKGRGDDFGF